MRQYGLIGFPLSHSFSKKYFTEKFDREQITDALFDNFPIPSIEDLPALLQKQLLLRGLAVTIPYKKAVIRYLDTQSSEVQQLGACNCIYIKNGKLAGHNTDVIGFERSFTKKLQPHHRKALILGTGGASAAVAYVLDKLGIGFNYVSRSADRLNHVFGYDELDNTVLNEYTVIINTTPLGTFPETDSRPHIPYHLLTKAHYLFDLVYNPPLTRFLQHGAERHCITENGYEMLVLQAEENWRIWNA